MRSVRACWKNFPAERSSRPSHRLPAERPASRANVFGVAVFWAAPMARSQLKINGTQHEIELEPNVSLLDALRERLGLTGTKKGCDFGQCGACTVLINGRRILSCMTLAMMHANDEITTIEGVAPDGALHSLQHAFIEHDAFQCGFCTAGQIVSALGLIAEARAVTDDEIREAMSGNLCRCGAYANILAAVRQEVRRAGI